MCVSVVVGFGVGVGEAAREGEMARVCRPLRLLREDHLYFIEGEAGGLDGFGDGLGESRWTCAEVGFKKGRGPLT